MEAAGSSEHGHLSTKLHGVTPQKTVIWTSYLKILDSHICDYDGYRFLGYEAV
jgi:hypothetical protein